MTNILNFPDNIVLQVQSFEIDVMLESLYFLNVFEMQVQFIIQFWVFIESFFNTQKFDILLT